MVALRCLGVAEGKDLVSVERPTMGGVVTDDELINRIAWDPEGGIREVISRFGDLLLGRLRKHARDKRYGDAFVEDVFQRALLRLLQPELRRELLAAGGEILPWLTRWGYWRLDDEARRQAVGAQKTSAPPDPAVPTDPGAAARAL